MQHLGDILFSVSLGLRHTTNIKVLECIDTHNKKRNGKVKRNQNAPLMHLSAQETRMFNGGK